MAEIEKREDHVLLSAVGDLVEGRLDQVRLAAAQAAEVGSPVVLALPRATVIDSLGIGSLVACREEVVSRGAEFLIQTEDPELIKLFHLLKLDFLLRRS